MRVLWEEVTATDQGSHRADIPGRAVYCRRDHEHSSCMPVLQQPQAYEAGPVVPESIDSELKREDGKLTALQEAWALAASPPEHEASNHEVYLWRPGMLDEIEGTLR